MVGLPARGKTFIARRLERYLNFLGCSVRVFNVGAYRRRRYGSGQPHSFFDPDNESALAARRAVATEALDDLLTFLETGGDIGIYDATNNTRERRALVRARCTARGVAIVYVESICNDPAVVEVNIRVTKARSPDYQGADEEEAVRDFRMRIEHYRREYEEVGEGEGSFVKIIDVGREIRVHALAGRVWPERVATFLRGLHARPRTVWLTRHGESTFNVAGRIGGDAPLSADGRAYAARLAGVVRHRMGPDLVVWTSTLLRTIETAQLTGRPYRAWRALDEIDAGVCDGMTYREIADAMPREFAARASDKFRYRYPCGESYRDVTRRLEPLVLALERERRSVLVVGHQAVLRALYAYWMDRSPEGCPFISVPLHTLLEIRTTEQGTTELELRL
jgi:broad specificity phosphatase PhoE/predicted kinase